MNHHQIDFINNIVQSYLIQTIMIIITIPTINYNILYILSMKLKIDS